MRFLPKTVLPVLAAVVLISAFSATPRLCAEDASPKNVPPIARDEVARRGDFVERILPQNTTDVPVGQTDASAAALEPPADDSHKWFITLIDMPACSACQRLKVDFAHDPNLATFVDVQDHKESWAHYNVYSSADLTQAWRFKKLRLSAFPTVLIQPPRDGSYGDPRNVVVQITGYDGDAAKMAGRIRNAILAYAQAQQRRAEEDSTAETAENAESGERRADEENDSVFEEIDSSPADISADSAISAVNSGIGQQAPFDVPGPNPLVPQIDFPRPFQPQPQPMPQPVFPNVPQLPFINPIQPQFDIGSLLTMLLSGALGGIITPTNIMLVIGGVYILREIRKARGKEPIVPDAAFNRFVEFLQGLLNASPTKPAEPKPEVKEKD